MIKINIEMPKTCNGCFANQGSEDLCSLMSEKYPENVVLDYAWNDIKPSWCPLIEEKSVEDIKLDDIGYNTVIEAEEAFNNILKNGLVQK